MSHLILIAVILIGLFAAIAVIGAAMKRQTGNATAPDEATGDDAPAATDYAGYERRKFLFSPAEYSFFKVLQLAMGSDYAIQVKVRIADLIEVRKGSAHYQHKLNYITRKHLDFVLCDPKTMVPVFAIELDDRSHDGADRQKRDAFVNGLMTAVAMPLVRIPVARGYSGPEMKAMICKALGTVAAQA